MGGGSQKRGEDLAELHVCMFVASMGSASVAVYEAACVFVARCGRRCSLCLRGPGYCRGQVLIMQAQDYRPWLAGFWVYAIVARSVYEAACAFVARCGIKCSLCAFVTWVIAGYEF